MTSTSTNNPYLPPSRRASLLIVSKYGPGDSEEAKERFRVKMTEAQFAALALRLDKPTIVNQVQTCRFAIDSRRAKTADDNEIAKWMRNAWNTERLLRATTQLLEDTDYASALQWSFPQAYYSVFAAALAFFNARGFTEKKHNAVIETFGRFVAEGRYPPVISFCVSGFQEDLEYKHVTRPQGYHSIDFNPADPQTIDLQIAQFLNATHELALEERRELMRGQFRTLTGKPRKSLKKEHWVKVAEAVGWTSLLGLLYRKRLKANYGDIDTFIAEDIRAAVLQRNLVHVVSSMNFVHEFLLARAIGIKPYSAIYESFRGDQHFLQQRFQRIQHIIGAEQD